MFVNAITHTSASALVLIGAALVKRQLRASHGSQSRYAKTREDLRGLSQNRGKRVKRILFVTDGYILCYYCVG